MFKIQTVQIVIPHSVCFLYSVHKRYSIFLWPRSIFLHLRQMHYVFH